MSLIYSRSPFFIQSPTGDSTTVSLYVWNGNSSDVPTSAQYTLTKAHNSSGKATFEVSELIRDYVDQSFNGDYVTEAVWVYISKSVTTGGGGGTVTSDKYLATDGYIDEDFVQYWITNSDNNLKSDEVLMSNDYISVPEDTTAVIPTKDADMAVFYKDGEVKFISELVDKNKISSSNDFTLNWGLGSALSLTEGQQSDVTNNNDAWLLSSNGSSGFSALSHSVSFSGTHTYSVFAKKGTNSVISLRSLSGTDCKAEFNLDSGTVISKANVIEANIKRDAGDWFRVYMTFSASNSNIYIYPNPIGTADAGDIYIQNAQLETGALTEYNGSDSHSSGAINYATSAGQSASTFYARVMKDRGTIIDENCSDDIMEYVSELDIDEAHIIKSDGKVEVISVETLPCNKYENVRLTFVNKFGALQDIHFSAKTTESMNGKGSSYNSINFDYDNLSNNYGSHSVRDFNKNATVSHTLNTDYLHESYSEVFRQLIVSEEVWMEHKGSVKPVNVTTNSLQKKTHANNGLVQFTVSVKESHSLINNIR